MRCGLTMLAALALAGAAMADEVTIARSLGVPLVGDELGVEDVTLASGLSRMNGGAFPQLAVGRDGGRKSLIRFQLAPLKGKIASVQEATLRLTPIAREGREPVEIAVYEVAAANGAWQEGQGEFRDNAEKGECTWSYRAFPETRWQGSAGLGLADADFQPEPVAQFHYDGGPVEIPLPPALITRWLEAPEENTGLLLVALDSEGAVERTLLVHSSEAEVISQRPSLVIRFE